MSFSVYIIQSETTERYYVGHSEDHEARLQRHNNGENISTRYGIPWKSVYVETFETRGEAMRRELQIKKRGVERYLRGVAQPG